MNEPKPSADSPTPTSSNSPTRRDTAARFEAGQTFGEFTLQKLLGKGGMAEVWLAEQTSLKRQVALKLMRPDMMSDDTYVKRFQTEAKAAAGLTHPNIVQVYVIGEVEEQYFIAQEYVQGNTLRALIQKKGQVDLPLALHILRQVAAAIQAAGDRGIVHRDIKPENIILTKKGEAKVADFGLAQVMEGGEKLALTQEGVTMGTPLYMSPEQVTGKKLDTRSDLYSLGVTAFHLLSGQPPFTGDTAVAVAVQHLKDEPPSLTKLRPDLPMPVVQLVERLMAKNPDERYPSAAPLVDDLRKLLRAVKENGRADAVELADIGTTAKPSGRSFAARRPIIALTLLCLLAGSASAGLGWWLRPKDPRKMDGQVAVTVKPQANAEAQFQQALFKVNDEDEWRAVIELHRNAPDSAVWVNRAREQLLLKYLRDRNRWSDAESETQDLRRFAQDQDERNRRSAVKAMVAEAALAAYRGNTKQSRSLLDSHAVAFEKQAIWFRNSDETPSGGAWTRLVAETLELISNSNRPASPADISPPTPPVAPKRDL